MYHLQSLFYLFSTAGSVAAYDHAFKYENESRKRLCAILRYLLKVLLIATFYESYFVNNRKKFLWNILLKETPLLIKKKIVLRKILQLKYTPRGWYLNYQVDMPANPTTLQFEM